MTKSEYMSLRALIKSRATKDLESLDRTYDLQHALAVKDSTRNAKREKKRLYMREYLRKRRAKLKAEKR